jgi:hypothetical protein
MKHFPLRSITMKHLPLIRDNKIIRMEILVKIMILQNEQPVMLGSNHVKFN